MCTFEEINLFWRRKSYFYGTTAQPRLLQVRFQWSLCVSPARFLKNIFWRESNSCKWHYRIQLSTVENQRLNGILFWKWGYCLHSQHLVEFCSHYASVLQVFGRRVNGLIPNWGKKQLIQPKTTFQSNVSGQTFFSPSLSFLEEWGPVSFTEQLLSVCHRKLDHHVICWLGLCQGAVAWTEGHRSWSVATGGFQALPFHRRGSFSNPANPLPLSCNWEERWWWWHNVWLSSPVSCKCVRPHGFRKRRNFWTRAPLIALMLWVAINAFSCSLVCQMQ